MADVTKPLYNPHDGLTGRDGGPYLDQVERKYAEERRAQVEGREPDFENAPATAGTPLVTSGQLVNMLNPASNPSQQVADPTVVGVELMTKNKDYPLEAATQADFPDLSSAPDYRAADPTIRSVDEGSDDEPIVVEQENENTTLAEPNASGEFFHQE
jgi:hypothetical protein